MIMKDEAMNPFSKGRTMTKAIGFVLFLSLPCIGSLKAQTGVRFGLKAGYSLATQYGSSPADNT
jgi:hypothetical protein